MITYNTKNQEQKKIINENDFFKKTTIILKNRFELLKNKKKYIQKKITEKNINSNKKKINSISESLFYQSKMLQDKKITIILQKIQEIDPWYKEICKLKKLPKIVQRLAIHTLHKKTDNHWYVFLQEKNKYLMQYNTWIIFKKELKTITEKKIRLIIHKKNRIKTSTPYEWFKKIYKEKILKEHLLLIKNPHVQFLKQYFHAELNKKDIIFTSC